MNRNTSEAFRLIGLAIIASLPASTALAQLKLDTVTVTSQKREQNIQDVPIAVSAFTEEFLQDSGVDDVIELQFFTLGLVIANNQSGIPATGPRPSFMVRFRACTVTPWRSIIS